MAFNAVYAPTENLKILAGVSRMSIARVSTREDPDRDYQYYQEYKYDGQRVQKFAYSTLQHRLPLDGAWSVNTKLGVKRKEMTEDAEVFYLWSIERNYGIGKELLQTNGFIDASLNLGSIFDVGFSRNKERFPDERISTRKFTTIYASLCLADLIPKNEVVSEALFRYNKTSGHLDDEFLELGFDLGLWKDKFHLSATYSQSTQQDEVGSWNVTRFLAPEGGFSYPIKLGYESFEFDIKANITSFWTATLSWSNINSEVILYNPIPNLDRNYSPATRAILDVDYYGHGFSSPDGFSVLAENPDWILYFSNDFDINKFSVGCFFTYQKGGFVTHNSQFEPYYEIDLTSLILRNLYFEYRFENLFYCKELTLGVNGQNIWGNTDFPDNYIVRDSPVQLYNHMSSRQNDRTFNVIMKLAF